MTMLPTVQWRCGSCDNRRGALIVVVPDRRDDAATTGALADLLPTEAAVATLRDLPPALPQATAAIEAWLDGAAGDAEELWLVGVRGGGAAAAALVLHAPERFAGLAMVGIPHALGAIVRRSAARAAVREIYLDTAPAFSVERQRDLAVWFAGRFARFSGPSAGRRTGTLSPDPTDTRSHP